MGIEQSNAIQCNPIGGNGADPDNLLALAVIAARARASLGEISMNLETEWGRHVATTQVVQGHDHPSRVHYSTVQGITAPLDLVSHTLPPSFVPSLSPPIPRHASPHPHPPLSPSLSGAYKSSMNAVLAKEEYNSVLEEVKAFSVRVGRRPRILVAKMGQDGEAKTQTPTHMLCNVCVAI